MKILIIGTVGTGKTTLARKLSKEYNIKYYEIDSIVHDDSNNGIKRSIEEQNKIIKEIDKEKKLDYRRDIKKKFILFIRKSR